MLHVAASVLLVLNLPAQADALADGIAAANRNDLVTAQRDFVVALRSDPQSYPACWRLSLVLIDMAKQTPDRVRSPARDSLYQAAERYARRAVALSPDDAEGHFALANAIGRASLTGSAHDRVRRAREVRAEALRAIALDPRQDGAWHILGRWNAEVERLSPLQRLFARAFLGASVFDSASWQAAETDLRRAVELAPERIVHRLDLADVLVSRKKWSAAAAQLDTLATLPAVDVSDTMYQRQARELRARVAPRLAP